MATSRLVVLDGTDFKSDEPNDIRLNIDECCLVLLYDGQAEDSQKMLDVYTAAAQTIVAPTFYLMDLSHHRQVAKRFKAIETSASPLRWAYLRALPVILTYQQGVPQGFYNGPRSVKDLAEYALTLACRPDYYEPENIYGGIKSDNTEEVPPPPLYQRMKSSTDLGTPQGLTDLNGQTGQAPPSAANQERSSEFVPPPERQPPPVPNGQSGPAQQPPPGGNDQSSFV